MASARALQRLILLIGPFCHSHVPVIPRSALGAAYGDPRREVEKNDRFPGKNALAPRVAVRGSEGAAL